MKKIYLIIKREYLIQVRQKSFIITTLFSPLFIILLLYCYFNFYKKNNIEYRIGVLDKEFMNISKQNDIKFFYIKNIKNYNINKLSLNALLYKIYTKNNNNNNYKLYLLNNNYIYNNNLLYNNIKSLIFKLIIYKKYYKNINHVNFDLKLINKKNKEFIENKIIIIIIMMYSLMMFIIIYSVKIMRSILEEKNSRIIEIIISSVKPYQLMIGKIIGNAAVAFTQFIFWILSLLLIFIFIFLNKTNFIKNNIPEINGILYTLFNKEYIFIIIIFFIYFLGGYLIFSSIFSAIASSIEIDSDYQQYSIIVSIILLISFYFGIYALNNPKNILVLFLSIFPITSPIVMLSRMYHYVPIWEIILSILILILSIIKIIKLSSIIYSNNILFFRKKNNK